MLRDPKNLLKISSSQSIHYLAIVKGRTIADLTIVLFMKTIVPMNIINNNNVYITMLIMALS